MTYAGDGDSPLGENDDPRAPIEERPPTLRAAVFLLAPDRSRRARVEALVPDRLPLQSFGEPGAFVEELGSDVAVALLSLTVDEDDLMAVIRRTIAASEHAQIALLADESSDFLDCELPHDEMCVPPFDEESFPALVKRLYVRAYYSTAIERFYSLCLSTQYHELRVKSGEADDDGRLERLKKSTELTRAYVEEFRRYLEPADFEALADRDAMLTDVATAEADRTDPGVHGLPKSCPECGLDWTVNHGSRYGSGYESIGANTWRCTRCSHVLSNPDPSNKWVM